MYAKVAIFSTVLVLAAVGFASSRGPSADDAKAVEEASAEFYRSLNTLFTGDAGPMTDIWSHAEDVTYMGPMGGIQVGWDEVRAMWESQAEMKLGGRVEAHASRLTVGRDLAFVQCYEIGNNVDAEGRPLKVSIRATNLFRKENGQWKMIGHHTDLLPYLEDKTLTTQSE